MSRELRSSGRRLGTSIALALLIAVLAACGAEQVKPAAKAPSVISGFGQAAGPSDRSEITALVRSYYAAAADGDGERACGLLFFALAEVVSERYHWAPGPRYLNGADTCKAVLARVFEHFHTVLRLRPTVVLVRVSGKRARALLGWRQLPSGYVEAVREGGVWKLDSLLAQPV